MCMKSGDVTDAGKIQSFIKVYRSPATLSSYIRRTKRWDELKYIRARDK